MDGPILHEAEFHSGGFSCTTSSVFVIVGKAGILSGTTDVNGNLTVCVSLQEKLHSQNQICVSA